MNLMNLCYLCDRENYEQKRGNYCNVLRTLDESFGKLWLREMREDSAMD